MNADPILAELWAVRDRLAARFDYDVDAIFRHIKAEEAKSGLRYVECPPRRLSAAENGSIERGARGDSTGAVRFASAGRR